ncbi:hypothetical protein CISG_06788 [Coccidioides immitis RMSCC 3703]|uniref:Uncharacterized protein n=1 Tax=Coccidioides immitis RMSCC 3703 TaxID=454286 RepID=A0A0J8QZW0_COCIT|nr:hypothetical protein CISG_06788 [Coccidioides immitis RMSCC 3703]
MWKCPPYSGDADQGLFEEGKSEFPPTPGVSNADPRTREIDDAPHPVDPSSFAFAVSSLDYLTRYIRLQFEQAAAGRSDLRNDREVQWVEDASSRRVMSRLNSRPMLYDLDFLNNLDTRDELS